MGTFKYYVLGNFYDDKNSAIDCTFDHYFKCIKSAHLVKITLGSKFRFQAVANVVAGIEQVRSGSEIT